MSETFRDRCLAGTKAAERPGRCLVIGEVAQTHDGSLGQAHAFIDAIARAGADAVKFQTHIAAAESTPDEPWRIRFSPQDERRYDYWRRMEFTADQWSGLKEHADASGLLFLSSPFSLEACRLLKDLGMRVWKIASGEIGNVPMLDEIANTGDPVILSSGISDWAELDQAVSRFPGSTPKAVLQCTTAYPCPPEKTGLNLISEIRSRYGCAAGLSDHSGKIFAGLAAATLGAEVLEVHVTMSREMFGPDVKASVTTAELRELVEGVRDIESMLAHPVEKESAAREGEELRKIFTKSLYAASFIAEGTVLDQNHFQLKKPGVGLAASELPRIVGRRLRRDLAQGQLLSFNDLDP
ncbi:MAG TPA: N-acetylneuraminate synthase family protein [Pyrinomonadaceae bacterium]